MRSFGLSRRVGLLMLVEWAQQGIQTFKDAVDTSLYAWLPRPAADTLRA